MKKSNPPQKQKQKSQAKTVAQLEKEIKQLLAASGVPAAMGKTNRSRKPVVHTEGDAVVVTHSELFDWPVGSLAYSVNLLAHINPGKQQVFPWLGGVAQNFEEYRFRKLEFKYEPRCSTQQAGQLVMAIDPKSGDRRPDSIQTMSTYSMRANTAMWKPTSIKAEKGILAPRRFVRSDQIVNDDVKSLYDVGSFILVTDGAAPAAAIIGEVEVSYTVELYNPASPPETFIPAMWINGVASGASPSNLFGNAPATGGHLFSEQDVNGVSLKNCVQTGVNQPTRYIAWLYVAGTGLTGGSVAPTHATTHNTVATPNGAGTIMQLYYVFSPLRVDPVLVFTVTGTTVSEALLIITRVSDNQDF
jgi:hypothetical protein